MSLPLPGLQSRKRALKRPIREATILAEVGAYCLDVSKLY